MTPLLKRLERAGLVSRKRDPADERRALVEPTAAGAALRERAKALPKALLCQPPLTRDELVDLHATLTRLSRALRKSEGQPTDAD